ncbi:MAG: hypothetical protein LBS30_05880 [Planctomycetota bacterium]|jgi:hypothetical protein|nr:hypothetical protein [Planctomycetota bacterium]
MKAGLSSKMIVAVLALGAVVGCNEAYRDEWLAVGPESRQGDVSVYRDVQFADIPVPEEYVLLPVESSSFQGSLFRNAHLVYQGFLEWTRALDFYRERLPQAGWQLNKTERGYDFRVLYFDKGQEKLIVVVRQIRNGSRAEIQLDNVDKNDLLLKGKLINPGY